MNEKTIIRLQAMAADITLLSHTHPETPAAIGHRLEEMLSLYAGAAAAEVKSTVDWQSQAMALFGIQR